MEVIRVKVNQGVVRGSIEPLPDGRKFQKFTGIPYAHPPINELRFKAPKKLEKFASEEIDCTIEGSACYHRSTFHRDLIGAEDCLLLNVFVPHNSIKKNLPVMFWIHGGQLK